MVGQPFGLADLTHILITHGHIDHFGGLTYVRPRTQALLGVHELDLRNLTNYEERLTVVSRRLKEYLIEAGVARETIARVCIEMYKITKSHLSFGAGRFYLSRRRACVWVRSRCCMCPVIAPAMW